MRFSGIFTVWLDSLRLLWEKKWYVPVSGIIDFVFLFAFGLYTGPVFDALARHLIIIGSLVSQGLRIGENVLEGPARHFILQFFCLLAVLGIVVFAVYCIFQGFGWHIARSAAGRRENLGGALLRFARINALWFVLFSAWWIISVVLDLRRIFVEKISGQPAVTAVNAWLAVLVVISYFAVISYALLAVRPAFVLGFRKAFLLFPAFLLAAIPCFLVAGLVSGRLFAAAAAIVFFALCAFAKVFVIRVVSKVGRHGI